MPRSTAIKDIPVGHTFQNGGTNFMQVTPKLENGQTVYRQVCLSTGVIHFFYGHAQATEVEIHATVKMIPL